MKKKNNKHGVEKKYYCYCPETKMVYLETDDCGEACKFIWTDKCPPGTMVFKRKETK